MKTIRTTRGFVSPFLDRSAFDNGDYSADKGWSQVETGDKGSAIWVNPETLAVFTLTEGDTCLRECESSEDFVEILSAIALYAFVHGWGPITIDSRGDSMRRAFIDLGFNSCLHIKLH